MPRVTIQSLQEEIKKLQSEVDNLNRSLRAEAESRIAIGELLKTTKRDLANEVDRRLVIEGFLENKRNEVDEYRSYYEAKKVEVSFWKEAHRTVIEILCKN
ncbi:hypothetical protein KC865_00715 [Candidatus Kaiserbacteria bacterium]|nr:hypothetical protein [Candidatus Kaiserbacteria bacterium]USN92138.1 MAG: hypothetical protein H6782_04665 [Candidatus Nomurabacteria bacterium]